MEATTTTTTPVTTSESSAAPAISAPTPSVTPSERPTFAQAFAQDAALHAGPSTSTEGATIPPVDAAVTESATPPQDKPQGEPPQEKWPTILTNARAKERDAVLTEMRQKVPSLDSILANPQVFEKGIAHFQKLAVDPPGHWRAFTTELLAHPTHGPALKSELARMFGGLRQQAAASVMPPPDVDIVDANGQVTGKTYSADQLAKREAWRDQQQELKARARAEQERTARTKAAEAHKQLETRADDAMAEVLDILDGDKTHITAVIEMMDANPKWSAHRAALEVRKTKIAPAAAGKAQAQVLEDLKTKAAAQSVNPAGAVVAPTKRPSSFLDPSLKW
jgi:hypothetical protein